MSVLDRIRRLALAPACLVGAPRSGTTWLQRLLLHHPACCGGQETHWFVQLDALRREARRKLAMPRPHGVLCHLDEPELLELMRRTWIEVATPAILAAPSAGLLIEKTPDHARHLDLIDELLPDARVVHLVRDPEAVVASLLAASRTEWGRPWAPGSVEAAARVWATSVEAAESSGVRLGPSRFLSLRYHDLVQSPHETLARVWRFLGLDPDDAIIAEAVEANALDAARRGGGTRIDLHGAAGERPLHEPAGFVSNPGRPTLTWWQRRRCRRVTGDLARRLGLDRTDAS